MLKHVKGDGYEKNFLSIRNKHTSIDNNNKNIYGISVFNVYSDGQIESLYISSR
ncbi:hypothetical protein [Clostridium thermobutyricum]|uniref:hypothetical protein n=1 Tax=Clostridium thermobutyricum TaxID=29372 RepID=UPI001301E0E1|nr:hypothetical protein [Clostridium thermobutyricum]